ncbi:pyridoxamine 5'-phosphate oxidase [Subsaximicrobium wynnwilliamsii]|uniref:Pyridoxine/pyridoxamine 5'-phosphate oxidase n=1 Tax=Subsaximicrobium wynnwilliamsii TaxID=291179 RepID=A0A5C6ZC78_9FLAO|nr:pyridoxamine 5'-phosphate oxidase [Subsaximicrobium wynnwilliamsii]TXD83293.1 pyridoxamine 5'-phosphate oxidase [Subsaximicrobium wynnwilliamsii]TXD87392.1 pyridoxamine 5'-phosphate oxidase [Subsaximicrobium wynnwilliamsii]TXE03316.1 pyridoxamine 5'-phosphate oxidase [Subsaximicrobium wynnwilliamsii]
MKSDLGNYRKSYEKEQLLEKNVGYNPFDLFKKWFEEVETNFDVGEVNAMTLSTIGLDGFPKSRVVLLKEFSAEGFTFYTNYESEKGRGIMINSNVCLSFFWETAQRQVIIKGRADKIEESQSDAYFQSRPRGSQLGALVSHQSKVIESRKLLEDRLHNLENEYEDKVIERPDFWGGIIVKPVEIEFWQGRPNRLHDRLRYKLDSEYNWKRERLSP